MNFWALEYVVWYIKKYWHGIYLSIYIYLRCEKRSSWNSTTLAILYLPVIHMNPKQIYFFEILGGIFEAQGTSILAIFQFPKWHFWTPACNLNISFAQNHFIWNAMKGPSIDLIQKMSWCLSEKISWIISRIPHRISKTHLFMVPMNP